MTLRVQTFLLFDLLVDSLALCSDACHLVSQLHAGDSVILAESQADLQAALDVVHAWCVRWRFSFGVGPTKSAAMVFGASSLLSSVSRPLGGIPLPVVARYRYLGVVFTPDLSWRDRMFHQSSAWCHGEGLTASFPFRLRHSRVVQCLFRLGVCWR